jgi:hypothetical protein
MAEQVHSTGTGRFASPEETESTGQGESRDSAATAGTLRRSRIDNFIHHEAPFPSVHRTTEEAVHAHTSSMAKTIQDFDLMLGGRRSTSPGGKSNFRGGSIVQSANTTVQNVQSTTRSSPITPLNVENRLLKPTEYFESLEKLESEVQSRSLLNMLNVSFPVQIHI